LAPLLHEHHGIRAHEDDRRANKAFQHRSRHPVINHRLAGECKRAPSTCRVGLVGCRRRQ
jgi:hypothetical protein